VSRGVLTPGDRENLGIEKVGGILEQENGTRLLFLPTKNFEGCKTGLGRQVWMIDIPRMCNFCYIKN
jgi:hypothetical protein